MKKEKVVVTGLGCLVPGAFNIQEFWGRMVCAESALGSITRFDTAGYRTKIGGELTIDIPEHLGLNVRGTSRVAQFALAAASETLVHAGLADQPGLLEGCGICLGSGLGGIYFSEDSITALHRIGPRGVSPMEVPFVDPNGIVSQVAIRWGMRGPQLTISTACSSSAHALGHALDMIRAGRCNAVLAGGVEATMSPLVFAGFDRIRAMSARNDDAASACRPFSDDRDGFVMSEGAAMLLLEAESRAKARGAHILAELKGYGATGGAFNTVSPRPDGDDLLASMRAALADSGIEGEDLDMISPHGTGTRLNDEAEEQAMRRLLGDRLDGIPMTPIKQLTGHMLGAAAALESVHIVKSIVESFVTPVHYYESSRPLTILRGKGRETTLRNVLNNSFGFGNNNASLIFGAYQ